MSSLFHNLANSHNFRIISSRMQIVKKDFGRTRIFQSVKLSQININVTPRFCDLRYSMIVNSSIAHFNATSYSLFIDYQNSICKFTFATRIFLTFIERIS